MDNLKEKKDNLPINSLKAKKRAIALENLKKAHGIVKAQDFPLEKYIDLKALERVAEAELTDKQLAVVLDINQRTMKMLRRRADFLEILNKGKAGAKKAVESSLFAAAIGDEYEEITRERVLIGRVRQIGKEDKPGPQEMKLSAGSGHGQERIYSMKNALVITKTVTKRIARDVEAIKFYLSNIDPSNWKIRSQTDANITKRVEFTELVGKTRDDMAALRDRIGKRIAEVKATKEAVVKN